MKYFTPLNLPQYDLLSCMDELLQQELIDWGKHGQICINTTPDEPDNYHHGDASLKYEVTVANSPVSLPSGSTSGCAGTSVGEGR